MTELSYGELVHAALLKNIKNPKHRKIIEALLTMSSDVNYGKLLSDCLVDSDDIPENIKLKMVATILNGNQQFTNDFRKSVNSIYDIKTVNELTLDYELYLKNKEHFYYLKNNRLLSYISQNKNSIIQEVHTYLDTLIKTMLKNNKINRVDKDVITLQDLEELNTMYTISKDNFNKLDNNLRTTLLTEYPCIDRDDHYKIITYVKIPILGSFEFFDIVHVKGACEAQLIELDSIYFLYMTNLPFKINIPIELKNPAEKKNNKKNKDVITTYKSFQYTLLDDAVISLHYLLYRQGLISTELWSGAKAKENA